MKTILFFTLLLVLSFAQDNTYTKYYAECKKIA